MTAYKDDFLGVNATPSITQTTSLQKMMLRLSTTNRVSTNTSSAFLKYCPVKRYIYTCHNNTIVQLVCMKCEMKWEESGL